jgi:lysophospholipase L1-like esterase
MAMNDRFFMRCSRRLTAAVLTAASLSASGAQPLLFLGLGDSIGEGVQSADANARTQPCGYLNLVARQIGVPFPLPLIGVNPAGVVGTTEVRRRLAPYVAARNLAVSGTDVTSLLNERADAAFPDQCSTETDLVLFPRTGSQMDLAERLDPDLTVCWIGNNDALGTILAYSHLDASQLTPVSVFEARFREIAQRLTAGGGRVVFATVPSVTSAAFLVNREDLIRLTGAEHGLLPGHCTSLLAALLIRLRLDDGSVLQNPDYVLDPAELQTIEDRILEFNRIILREAAAVGAPVVDAHGLFATLASNPPVFCGVTLGRHFLGGLFSLDGVHPSNVGHALLANAFIDTIDGAFGFDVPRLSEAQLRAVFLRDPFVDKDGDGRVVGRPGAGLVESLAPLLGFSGDPDDFAPGARPAVQTAAFCRTYAALTGRGPAPGRPWTREDGLVALRDIFGLPRIAAQHAARR